MNFSRFFTIGVDTADALPASYDPDLVVASYVISALAGFAFLRFTSRIIELQASAARFAWMGAGALVMGLGVWAMHFVAMLAYRLPIDVGYDPLVTALSALPAVLGSAVALHVAARPTVTMLRLLLGGVFMGAGIGAMHYTGMAAMRFDAYVSYDPWLFATSIVVAVALAFLALFSTLWTMRRGAGGPSLAREIVGALFMGLAVSGMHYTAMTSAFCFAAPGANRGVMALDPEVFAAATTTVAVLVLILAIAGVIFDRRLSQEIARRQQAADRARLVDRRMRDAIEAMPDGLAVFDRKDALTIWNSRYFEDELTPEILKPGATYAELVRHRIETQFASESRERREARIAERVDRFKNQKTMMMQRPDGRWFFVRVRQTTDDDKVLVRTDITAVKQAEEMLRQREQHLALVMDNVADGLVTLDPQGVIGSFSRSAERIFGYEAAEMIGNNITMLLAEPDRTQLAAHLRQLAATQYAPRGNEPREVAARHKNGAKLSIELVLSRAEQGDDAVIIAALRDITERKTMHAQLQQSQKMEAIGQLTGGIAHDFNNLLGIIIGNLDLLKEILGGGRTKEQAFLDAALDSALRGADLNQRLLAFARRQSLQPERLDPTEVLTGMRNLLNRAVGERVTVRLGHGQSVWPIKVDLAQLESALINLAVNARDAMPDGGTLSIETSNTVIDSDYTASHAGAKPGEYVCITVSDTGVGMTAETQARAFEPFFTTKAVGKGTGLGLSMVFGFAQQSDGHVTIYSEPGCGTAVRLYLPRSEAGGELVASDRTAGERAPASLPTGSEIVLLVEDNEAMGDVAATQLKDLGYRVIGAKNAEHALKIIDDGTPIDLLFTDVVMPGALDGIALTHEAKRRRPSLKVLLTSGFSHRTSGAPDSEIVLPARLLTKPYRKHHLAESIRQALDE